MSTKALLITFLVLSLVASPVRAQTSLPLRAAVERALTENPQIHAALQRIEAAKAREQQAAALPNPNLTLMVDQVPIGNPGNGNYMAGVSQPLLLGGQRDARMAVARLDRELAELDRQILVRDLVAQVREAYAQLLFAHEEVQLARLNDDSARALLNATRARHQAGELARVDLLRAEVERSRALREIEAAEARELQAQGDLNVLLGREAQWPLTVETLPVQSLASLPPIVRLTETAFAKRSELRQAALGVERETMQRRLAQAGLWTGTEATFAAGTIAGQPGVTTTLTLPIPFYRQQGEIAEAEANRLRAEAERASLRHRITLEVGNAYRGAAIASRQAEAFRKSYLPRAERLADNAQRRFAVGEGSGLEVFEARRALRQTRNEYEQALLAYRQALARLERAVGGELRIGGK